MKRSQPKPHQRLITLGMCSLLLPPLLGAAQCEEECIDLDLDGYGEGGACLAPDCADDDPLVHPDAAEDCQDGDDDDCDGQVDLADLECNEVDMVEIPAGPFLRGICNGGSDPACGPGDPGYSATWSEVEKPMRELYLSPYLADVFEVSVADFAVCAEAGACRPANYVTYARNTICHYGKPGYESHPMNCVGWNAADEYCRFAGKRLPTEAEWEKAARGEDGRTFPWGNDAPNCQRVNYSNATNQFCVGGTAPVNAFPTGLSPFGLYNMAGNVYEWTADWYDPDYYDEGFPLPDFSPDVDPQGPSTGEYKIIRGGSWVSSEGFIRTTMKHFYMKTTATEDLGFRCVRSLP